MCIRDRACAAAGLRLLNEYDGKIKALLTAEPEGGDPLTLEVRYYVCLLYTSQI